jgi:hypothetical protein
MRHRGENPIFSVPRKAKIKQNEQIFPNVFAQMGKFMRVVNTKMLHFNANFSVCPLHCFETPSDSTIQMGAFTLKGQCHEMVAEIRPWSGRLDLN